jgi:hypothetical protein
MYLILILISLIHLAYLITYLSVLKLQKKIRFDSLLPGSFFFGGIILVALYGLFDIYINHWEINIKSYLSILMPLSVSSCIFLLGLCSACFITTSNNRASLSKPKILINISGIKIVALFFFIIGMVAFFYQLKIALLRTSSSNIFDLIINHYFILDRFFKLHIWGWFFQSVYVSLFLCELIYIYTRKIKWELMSIISMLAAFFTAGLSEVWAAIFLFFGTKVYLQMRLKILTTTKLILFIISIVFFVAIMIHNDSSMFDNQTKRSRYIPYTYGAFFNLQNLSINQPRMSLMNILLNPQKITNIIPLKLDYYINKLINTNSELNNKGHGNFYIIEEKTSRRGNVFSSGAVIHSGIIPSIMILFFVGCSTQFLAFVAHKNLLFFSLYLASLFCCTFSFSAFFWRFIGLFIVPIYLLPFVIFIHFRIIEEKIVS